MEWAREFGKQDLFLKFDFDKAHERVDWTFFMEMLSFFGFGSKCAVMINTLFYSTSSFVAVNNILYPRILLHLLIRIGCPLAPYIYVMTVKTILVN